MYFMDNSLSIAKLRIKTNKLTTIKTTRGYITDDFCVNVQGYSLDEIKSKIHKFLNNALSVYGDREIWQNKMSEVNLLIEKGESFLYNSDIEIEFNYPIQLTQRSYNL